MMYSEQSVIQVGMKWIPKLSVTCLVTMHHSTVSSLNGQTLCIIMVRNLNTKLGAVPLFGQYSNYRGPINYQDVQCSGNESSLSFCNRSLISDPSCTNTSRIAGVQCIEGTQTNSFILIVFLTINFCVTNSQSLLNASTLTQV